MSNLEKIVPPLDLCEQIPAGEFENSALVWVKSDPAGCVHSTGKWHVCLREGAELYAYNKWMPAPTVEEIWEQLPVMYHDGFLIMEKGQGNFSGKTFCHFQKFPNCEVRKSASEAALRLWFMVKGIKVKE